MTTWVEDAEAPASSFVEPASPAPDYPTVVLIPPFSSWTFNAPAGVETVKYRSAPDALRVGTTWGFGGFTDGIATCNVTLEPGLQYRLRRWIKGNEAQQGSGTFQRLQFQVDRGDGAFLSLGNTNPSAAPDWTEDIDTFTAVSTPAGRVRVACATQQGGLVPVGTFYWYIDDVVLEVLDPTYAEDPGGSSPWTEE